MSSIKFESNTNADDVLNMTIQWGYKPSSASKRPEPVSFESEKLSAFFRVLSVVISFISMLAGAATALAILAYIASQTGVLPFVTELFPAV